MEKTVRAMQFSGELYDVFDEELIAIRDRAYDIVSKLSKVSLLDKETAFNLEKELVGNIGEGSFIVPPFRCDYGINTYIGKNTHIDYDCCFLDAGIINIGDNVFIGTNCSIFTPCHPIHASLRWEKITEYALPVTIKSHAWIGGDVVITPGVTIGEGAVIGAGSVVTKDIPPYCIAVGNPCRVVRTIGEQDKIAMEKLQLNSSDDDVHKQLNGYLYNVEAETLRTKLYETLHNIDRLNKISNSKIQLRRDFIRTFIPDFGEGAIINSPFYLTYSDKHLSIGENSYINYDCIILNEANVTIGNNVLIGSKVSLYTSNYATLAKLRGQMLAYAKPITIEDNVWIGGSATILGGVTVGKNSIIGAGSVVVNDVPENSIVVGNPAKVLRKITKKDVEAYKVEMDKQRDDLSQEEKMLNGDWYMAMDYSMVKLRQENNKKTEAFSRITSSTISYKDRMAKAILGSYGDGANLLPPFTCDYGTNVHIAESALVNHSSVFLDTNKISIGKHALLGPKIGLYCAMHPYDVEARNNGIEKSKSIEIAEGAWLGGRVTVLPNVKIGKNSVIGAGSVVTKDIPDNVVAVGNPCRVIRQITDEDKINPIRKRVLQIRPEV